MSTDNMTDAELAGLLHFQIEHAVLRNVDPKDAFNYVRATNYSQYATLLLGSPEATKVRAARRAQLGLPPEATGGAAEDSQPDERPIEEIFRAELERLHGEQGGASEPEPEKPAPS